MSTTKNCQSEPAGKSGKNNRFKYCVGKEADKQRSLDECVEQNLKECRDGLQVMVKYFCGTALSCNKHSKRKGINWDRVKKSTQIAKVHILRHFYLIGLLGNHIH